MNNAALIAVFGATGTGKTTFINNVIRGSLPTHPKSQPYTPSVEQSRCYRVEDKNVVLFDMPSFDDPYLSDTTILKCISEHLANLYRNGSKLTGIIYLHRITDIRIGRTALRTFKLFLQLCGKDSLSNVFIVTTMWSNPPTSQQIEREKELGTYPDFFQSAIDQGAMRVRCPHKNHRSAHKIIRMMMYEDPIVMQVQRELVDEGRALSDTAAWRELERELTIAAEQSRAEMPEKAQATEIQETGRGRNEPDSNDLMQYQQGVRAAEERFLGELAALRKGYDDARWQRQAEKIRDELKTMEACQQAVRKDLEVALRQQEAAESQLGDFQRRLADLGV
ncbi:unnamed protein product [Rhizoctonia solani]|uniref:G domain-containing protein n=1 Tax=Rhizoctonia solani TaxID=456999 RepID=A0A8H3E395_9AGAM|nr:unnamed protein product [Rhizoctonia solani]